MKIETRWIGELVGPSDLNAGDFCFCNSEYTLFILPNGEAFALESLRRPDRDYRSIVSPIVAFQRDSVRRLSGSVIVEPIYPEDKCRFPPDYGNIGVGHLILKPGGLAFRIPANHYYRDILISNGEDSPSDHSAGYSYPNWRLLWECNGEEREFFRFEASVETK